MYLGNVLKKGKVQQSFRPRVALEEVTVEEAVAQSDVLCRGVPRGWECSSGGLEHKGRSTKPSDSVIGWS